MIFIMSSSFLRLPSPTGSSLPDAMEPTAPPTAPKVSSAELRKVAKGSPSSPPRDGRCMSMLLSFSNWNLRRLDFDRTRIKHWQNQHVWDWFLIWFWFEFTWSGREISVDINHDFLSLERQILGYTQPSLSFNPLTSMQNSSKFKSPSPSSADCYIIEWYRMAVSAVCADIQETLAFKV